MLRTTGNVLDVVAEEFEMFDVGDLRYLQEAIVSKRVV